MFTDGVCLFSFACYNSCLEYRDDTYRKARLVKPALQVVFTLLDRHGNILGEDTVDFRACACPTRDAPAVSSNISCRGNSKMTSNGGNSQPSNMIRQKLKASTGNCFDDSVNGPVNCCREQTTSQGLQDEEKAF